MSANSRELIVFPTELSMRRCQQEQALEHGFVDTSFHTTFGRLRRLCLPYASLKGRQLSGARELLMRRQVVDIALGHFSPDGTLGRLSASALEDVLEGLISELSMLPTENAKIVDWMLEHHRTHKLYELGTLFSVWRAIIGQEGYADRFDVNHAILKLLKGPVDRWPPLLRTARKITFRDVRWFNPFEEMCVIALNSKLKVRVESALPPSHAEAAADRMGQRIRTEIMAEPWAVWAEDLGDALAVDSPDLLASDDTTRISFSRSAGAYGEIEDLARQICRYLEHGNTVANRVALLVPDIGSVQDIIPHVFARFQIPYFFRRGRPVLSSPSVKAFLAWLAFPLNPERDTMIDLIRNPAIRIDDREESVNQLLTEKIPPRVDPEKYAWFRGRSHCSGRQADGLLAEWIVEPDDHFNSEAIKTAAAVLEDIGDQELPLADLVHLIEALLENATVKPRDSHEQGVWILNPHDAVGLNFDLVLFAGLNDGMFPGVPRQDALLNDRERFRLRKHLEEQGRPLPKMALPNASVQLEQESVLFLCAIGMAREQLVFSCQSADQEGNEKGEGEYYRKLWTLAGWGATDEIALSPYDTWRIDQLGENSVFTEHVNAQRRKAAEDRIPMPGESFLPIVPLPLCRAQDEALQAGVQHAEKALSTAREQAEMPAPHIKHLISMLAVESEREGFLDTPVHERERSVYCGHIGSLKEKIAEWFDCREELSPTALETLAQCRYVFLLERVFGQDDPRRVDDTPDPMERGGLIHSILQEIYTAVALGQSGIDAARYWAVKTSDGWVKSDVDGTDAIPLAAFDPSHGGEYEALARRIAERRMSREILGHSGIWAAERDKIMEMILNFVRYDAETCAGENRYPALFELRFGGETALNLGEVKVRGKIDRVDLIFDDTGALKRVRVLDYKGSSRMRNKREEYIDEILHNLDCQLPVYAFAAQNCFLGESNTAEANAITEAGYLFYQRDFGQIGKTLQKSLVPMNEEGLVSGFLSRLSDNVRRLKDGDFAVDPLIEAYNDYQSVCRTEAVSRDNLE